MTPLIEQELAAGSEIQLSWPDSPNGVVARVRRLGHQSLGPVLDVVVDDAAVAALSCGDLIHVASPERQFHGRVLHVETRWRTYGDRVLRSPSVLTVTAGTDIADAMQPRRFVRVPVDLDVRISVGSQCVSGRAEWLSPKGLAAVLTEPVPDEPDVFVEVALPSGLVRLHGWLVRLEPMRDGTYRIAVSFTCEMGVDPRLVDFVLRHGYTPVPAALAG